VSHIPVAMVTRCLWLRESLVCFVLSPCFGGFTREWYGGPWHDGHVASGFVLLLLCCYFISFYIEVHATYAYILCIHTKFAFV